MTGPMMAVTLMMAEMVKAASEVMSERVMSKMVMTGKSVAKTGTAESPRHGVGLSQRDSEQGRGNNGNGFSQQHRSHRQQRPIRKVHYPPSQRQIRPAGSRKRSG